MKDIRSTTLLHIACLNNRSDIAKLYLEYLKGQGTSDEEIKDWVNEGTDEGLIAIHFGAFKGSIVGDFVLVRRLIWGFYRR